MEDFPDIPLNRNEAYKLLVTSKGVEIEAITETGVYRAIQTLRQLTEKKGNGIAITGCEITDWPAFRIRGFMQDVGRTYISTDELKREIAILARYKINVFHWHLTENQAWRLQRHKTSRQGRRRAETRRRHRQRPQRAPVARGDSLASRARRLLASGGTHEP